MMFNGGLFLSSSGSEYQDLSLPDLFPVTLQRGPDGYRIQEGGYIWLSKYNGTTIYVSTSGNDTTGHGSISTPYATIDKALSVAADNDKISISPGNYLNPSAAISVDVALLAPAGGVYIGVFNDLSAATISVVGPYTPSYGGPSVYLYNVQKIGESPWVGFLRKDQAIGQIHGSARVNANTDCIDFAGRGIQGVYPGSSTSNFSTGTAEALQSLVNDGKILAWTTGDTDNLNIGDGSEVYIGPGITIANHGTNVIYCAGKSVLVLDGVEVCGGSDNTISHDGSGQLILLECKICGSFRDNIDIHNAAVCVEKNVICYWNGGSAAAADNGSTAHDTVKILRVGGTYRGGSRTIHDIDSCRVYIFSCSVGDPLKNDKIAITIGEPATPGNPCTLLYGDVTYLDSFGQGDITNLYVGTYATATQINRYDPWPY